MTKIGMEVDPVEQLDREQERAIAAVVRARFGNGDLVLAQRAVDKIASKRLRLRAEQARRRFA